MRKIIFIFLMFFLFNQNIFSQKNPVESIGSAVPIIDCGVCNDKAISLPILNNINHPNIIKTVNVLIYIDDEGNVEDAQAVSGYPLLRKLAEDAALKAKFNPFKTNGKLAFAKGVLVYDFKKNSGQDIIEGEKVIRKGIINGSATSLPIPEYPKEARERCIGGTVKIQVEVDGKTGNVISASPIEGDYLLYESSIEAVKKAKFRFFVEGELNSIIVGGIVVYNFDPFLQCVETNRIANSKAIKIFKPNIKSYLQEKQFTLDKSQNISVQIIVDMSGKVLNAKALNGHPLLRLAFNKSARETTFSPILITGKPIYTKAFLVYKVKPNGDIETKISDEIILGEVIELPKASFPAGADLKGKESIEVLVETEIDEKGYVISAEAVEGHPLLRNASVSAARRARFTPTYENGKTVKATAKILYTFSPFDRDGTEVEVKSIFKKSDGIMIISHFPTAIYPILLPQPKYPEAASAANIKGKVVVEILVNEDGNIEEAKIVSGHPLLWKASLEAAKQIKYEPIKLSRDKPVKVRTTVVYNFHQNFCVFL